MSAFFALLKRDLLLSVRQGGALGTALGFYMLVVTLLPLGLGADLNLLSRIAPGVLWIALLLAALLSLGRVFSSDYEDGSLDILATGSLPMELVVAAETETGQLASDGRRPPTENPHNASLVHKPGCHVPFHPILRFDAGPQTALAHNGDLFPASQLLTVWTRR